MADDAWLELDFRTSVSRRNVKYRERLRDRDEQRVVCDVSPGADASTVAEDEVARVGFGFVRWLVESISGTQKD